MPPQSALVMVNLLVQAMEKEGRREEHKNDIARIIQRNVTGKYFTKFPWLYEEADGEFWLGVARGLNTVRSYKKGSRFCEPYIHLICCGQNQAMTYVRRTIRKSVLAQCRCGYIGKPKFLGIGMTTCFACGNQDVDIIPMEVSLGDIQTEDHMIYAPVEAIFMSVMKEELRQDDELQGTRGFILNELLDGVRGKVPNYIDDLSDRANISKQMVCRHLKRIRTVVGRKYDLLPMQVGALI